MIEVNIFAGLRVVPLDTKVVAFIGLEDENCNVVTVTSVTPEIPWRFEGTLAELDEAMPEWAETAEEHDCELITVGIRRDWREGTMQATNAWMDLQLAKLDRIEAEAWEARERSKLDRVTTRQSKDAGGQTSASVEKAGRVGDARHLATVLTCIDRRCKLLGLDAPEKREVSGPDGGPILLGDGIDDAHIDKLLREHYRGQGGGR